MLHPQESCKVNRKVRGTKTRKKEEGILTLEISQVRETKDISCKPSD